MNDTKQQPGPFPPFDLPAAPTCRHEWVEMAIPTETLFFCCMNCGATRFVPSRLPEEAT